MSFKIAFAALSLFVVGLAALPAQAQHGRDRRHHRYHRRPAPRKVIIVEPNRPHRR